MNLYSRPHVRMSTIIEIASHLAHEQLEKSWNELGLQRHTMQVLQGNMIVYSEKAQPIFDKFYDSYYELASRFIDENPRLDKDSLLSLVREKNNAEKFIQGHSLYLLKVLSEQRVYDLMDQGLIQGKDFAKFYMIEGNPEWYTNTYRADTAHFLVAQGACELLNTYSYTIEVS